MLCKMTENIDKICEICSKKREKRACVEGHFNVILEASGAKWHVCAFRCHKVVENLLILLITFQQLPKGYFRRKEE